METLTGDKGGDIPIAFQFETDFDEVNHIQRDNFNAFGQFKTLGGEIIRLTKIDLEKSMQLV